MCHLHLTTHLCGCRDESRIVVAAHTADARCFETLSCRRRRRRCCARYQPILTTLNTSSHVVSLPAPAPSPPHPASEAVPSGSSASSSWEYRLPEYNVYGQYHTSYYSS